MTESCYKMNCFCSITLRLRILYRSASKKALFVSYVHIHRIISYLSPPFQIHFKQIFIHFCELHFSRKGLFEPTFKYNIFLHEDVNKPNANSNIANHKILVFQTTIMFNAIMHSLEFFLFQCDEITKVPIQVFCQKPFIGMYRILLFRTNRILIYLLILRNSFLALFSFDFPIDGPQFHLIIHDSLPEFVNCLFTSFFY